MSDFEPIEIQIESSSNKAEKGLDNIDKALSNIQSSLKDITGILGNLDSKIKPISRSMNSLTRAINGLNSNIVRNMSNDLANMANSASEAEKKTTNAMRNIDNSAKTYSNSVKEASATTKELNTEVSRIGDSASSFEKMLPAIKSASDSMERFNNWVEACFRRDLGIDVFSQQFRQIPQIMQEITASNGVQVITSQISSAIPLIEQVTNGMISFSKWIKDAFETDIGANNFAQGFNMLEQSIGTALVPFKSFIDTIKEAKTETTDFTTVFEMGFGGVPAVIDDALGKAKEKMREFFEGMKNYSSEAAEKMKSDFLLLEDFSERTWREFKGNMDEGWRETSSERIMPETPKDIPTPDWSQALQQVEQIKNSYAELAKYIGEDNAEMQVAVNIVNTLNRAFSMTKSGQMPWDTEKMREATAILEEMQSKIDRMQENFNNRDMLGGTNTKPMETWATVFEDIEKINSSFNGLSQKIGEANAEMSNLVDIRNRLNKAFADTESGKLPWSNEDMQRAYELLGDVNDRIKRVKESLKDPNRLEMDVEEPTSEIEILYSRLRDLQSLMSDMRNLKINFDNDQFRETAQEIERIQARIREIQGLGSKEGSAPKKKPQDNDNTKWMAQVIAIQHELEKASALFSKFGDIAKNALLKAITPLKLFKHEFEEIKGLVTMVSRIGSAFAMISKPITKVFDHMRKKAEQSFAKIRKAWAKVMRTFTFMLLRKAITHIISTINDAITSLAAFSKSIGTDFNMSMSILTSDLRYIGASLTAAFAPILNAIVPTFDSLTDAIVGVINKVNMFLAVLTHAKSYTIAKKKIVDYTEAMEDANKKAKQLTMGIDELNILSEEQSSAKDKEDMFDWMEIPTPQIDLPDWLKWLKDLLKKLWDGIKGMLAALWNAIKDAWNRVKDFFIKAIKHFIEQLVGLITDIISDLTRLFNTEKFRQFLERIFRIIAKIAEFFAVIIERIREALDYEDLGYRILEQILDILDTIAFHIENILDMMIEWAKDLTFVPFFKALLTMLGQVQYAVDQIGYTAERVAAVVLGILKNVIEDYLPHLLLVIGNIIEGIGNIAKQFNKAWDEVDFTKVLVDGVDGIMQALIPHLEAVGEYFKEWANGLDFKPFMKAVDRLLKALKPVADFIGGVFEDIVKLYVLPMAQHIIQEVIPRIADAISHFANAVDWGQLRSGIAKVIEAFEHMQGSIGEGVADAIDRIGQAVANFINSNEFQKFLENLANFMSRISPELVSNVLTGIGLAILRIAKALVKFVNSEPFQRFLNALINFLTYSDVNKIASILLNIAKAIVAFKFLAFVGEGLANFLTFIVLIGKAVQGLQSLAGALSAIGGVIKALSGAGAVFGGLVLAIKEFVDMWVNGWSAIKTILEALGLALAAVGAVLLGAPALIAGVIAGIVFAVSQLAILLHQHWDDIKNWFSSAWDNFKTWAISTWESITGGIAGVWTGFIEKIRGIWETVKGFFASVWESFKGWAIGIWNTIVDAVAGAWNTFLEKIQGVWATVSGWFSTTWENFKLWVSQIWQAIVQSVIDAWNGITEFLQGIWNTIWDFAQSIFGNIRDFILTVWNGVSTTIQNVWNFIAGFLSGLWNRLVELAYTVFGGIRDFLLGVWSTIQGVWETIWNTIVSVITGIWNFIKEQAEIIWNGVLEFFSNLWNGLQAIWETVWGTIRDVVIGIWNFISDTAHAVFETVANFLSSVWDSIVDTWTTIWNTIHDVVSGIWNKIKEVATTIFGAIKEFFEKLWQGVIDLVKKLAEKLGEALTKAKEWMENFIQTGKDAAIGFVKAVWEGLKGLAGKVWEIGKLIVEGLWEGIKGAFGWLQDKLDNSFVGDIIDTIRELFGIHSPSKVMADEVGAYLPQGIGEGIEREFPALIAKMKDQISSMTDMLHSAMDVVSKQMVDMTAKTEQALVSLMTKISAFAQTFRELMVSLAEAASDIGRRISDGILSGLSGLSSKIGGLLNGISGSLSFNVPAFATGGFPEDGLFYANHSELIGSFNGRTAVANNNQITDGIAQAVSQSLVPILNDIADSSRVTANKDFSVDIDSREIARANSNGQSKLGRNLISFS